MKWLAQWQCPIFAIAVMKSPNKETKQNKKPTLTLCTQTSQVLKYQFYFLKESLNNSNPVSFITIANTHFWSRISVMLAVC